MEKDGMRRAVQLMDEKRSEREAKMKLAREARRKAKEDADRKEEAERRQAERRHQSWWKVW
jgi:cytochrome c oxidase assembly protein subunit 20